MCNQCSLKENFTPANVLLRMQLRSHADGQPVKRFKRKMGYVQSDMCTRYEILNVASAQQ